MARDLMNSKEGLRGVSKHLVSKQEIYSSLPPSKKVNWKTGNVINVSKKEIKDEMGDPRRMALVKRGLLKLGVNRNTSKTLVHWI